MRNYKEYLIADTEKLKIALNQLNILGADAILFVIDTEGKLCGSLTDGDVRRGLLSGKNVDDLVTEFIQTEPKYILKSSYSIEQVIEYRNTNYRILPVLDDELKIINIINFRYNRSYLPMDAIIMAGGRGQRLSPMTDSVPKPLLMIGSKPIIEHNIDRLINYGVDQICISIRYLGHQIEDFFAEHPKFATLTYVNEDIPLGTIGAASRVSQLSHEYVLIMNSDILTNIDYEDFFLDAMNQQADLAIVSIPYKVNVPYAVLELEGTRIRNFKEKPTYTYFSNGGIYLIKASLLGLIPKDSFYDATDLMQNLIQQGKKVVSYSMRDYWLDIGRHEDFIKAQDDIKHIKF